MTLVPARAIAKASMLVLAAHLSRTLGSRAAVLAAGIVSAGVLATINVLIYWFSMANLGGIFHQGSATGAAVTAAREVLVQSPGLTAAALGMVLLMFFPAESHVSLNARVAGASRAAVALGEFVPVLAAVAFVAAGTAIGSTLFTAQTTSAPAVAFIGMEALVFIDVLAVLLVNQLFVALCRAFGAPEGVARIGGLLAGVGVIAVLLANLLDSLLNARSSWMSSLTRLVWGSEVPVTVFAAVATAAAAVVLLTALFAALTITPRSRSLGVGSRLVSVPLIGRPSRFVNFAVRESLLALRHPVSQLSLASAALLASFLVVGCRIGFVSLDIAVTGLAALFSTGVESAFGRALPWAWVLRQLGMRNRSLVLAQVIGSVLVGALLFVIALVIASPSAAVTSFAIPLGLVQLGMFSAIAYVSGVLAPYDRTAPLGMMLTSVIAVVIDAVTFWLISTLLPDGGVAMVACQLLVIGVLIAASIGLVRARMLRAI